LWRFFQGKLDDIRIYNRALTEAEIKQLYETTESKINQPPLAQFTVSSIQGAAPLTVTLDASAASDADGTLSRYDWQSSDGQMLSGKTATLTWDQAGEYSVTLTVTDDSSATSQAVKTLRVTAAPVPPISGCTNGTINDCRASYSFDGKVCVPCVVVPGAFGTSQSFALEMNQKPFSLAFEINPLTLKAHNFYDSCAANYSPLSGLLNLPCVSVGGGTYNVDMQQRPGELIFDVTGVR